MKLFRQVFLTLILTALALNANANTISGTLKTPAGALVLDSTLTFTISQSGIVAGSFAIVGNADNCGTSADTGAVVGITRPLVAPSVTPSTAAGSVPAATYYTAITYWITGPTETQVGPVAQSLLTMTGQLQVTAPTLHPTRATGYKIYVGTSASALHLQQTVTGFGNFTVTTYNAAGAAPPSANNTVCSIQFNDSIIPSFTFYRTTVILSSGATAPGFPQNWYLAGASVDVSTVYPLANVANATRFPTPLLLNPSSNAQQSVASPVTLNDYSLTAGAIALRAQSMAPPCSGTTGVIYVDNTGTFQFCQNGSNLTNFFGWFDMATGSLTGSQLMLNQSALTSPAGGKHFIAVFDNNIVAGGETRLISYDFTAAASKPLAVEASSIFLSKQVFVGTGVSTDSATDGIWGTTVNVALGTANTSLLSMLYNSTSSTLQIRSSITGSGAVKPISWAMRSSADATDHEFMRITAVNDQPGTGKVYNLVLADQGNGTSPAVTDFTTPIYMLRTQNASTHYSMVNASAGTSVLAGYLADNGTATTYYGQTGTGNSTLASYGFIQSSNGLFSMLATRFAFAQGASVVSANNMTLGTDGNVFVITSNTQINCITSTNWHLGSMIILVTASNPLVKNNFACGVGADALFLHGAADWNATAGASLTLVQDGSGWIELSHSNN